MDRFLSALVLALASALGLWALLAPFLPQSPLAPPLGGSAPHAADAPVLFLVLLGLCLVALVANLETRRTDPRLMAALGVLVALNASLRLLTGPGGVSAVFFLPILAGFVFGADFGFLLGVLSLFVSAVLTSGMGPWLPFQMFAAGWGGMVAGWLPRWRRRPLLDLVLVAGWGAAHGFLYGVILNLWVWPFLAAPAGTEAWAPGLGTWETVRRFLTFHVTTSLWWDIGRAVGNVALILAVGRPVVRLLSRFRERFQLEEIAPAEAPPASPPTG